MKHQMKDDLDEDSNWVPVTYRTLSYSATADLQPLAQAKLSPAQVSALETVRGYLSDSYERAIMDLKDASEMLKTQYEDSERRQLSEVVQAVAANLRVLNQQISICTDDFEACLDTQTADRGLGLRDYNHKFRGLGMAKQAKIFCARMINAAGESGDISAQQVRDLNRQDMAPIFQKAGDTSSPVIGFASCQAVYMRPTKL